MKKNAIILMYLAIITFANQSCQRKETMTPKGESKSNTFDFRTDEKFNELFKKADLEVKSLGKRIDNNKIIEISNIQNEEVRRLAIQSLSTEDKVDFWNYIIEYHINNDNFNNNQKILMTALKIYTVNKFFFENTTLKTIFNNYFSQQIRIQLNNAGISDSKMSSVFADGRLIYTEPIPQKPIPGETKLNCDCSPTTFWTMCNNCKGTDNCKENSNCGFLFLYTCDGLCPKYLPTGFEL